MGKEEEENEWVMKWGRREGRGEQGKVGEGGSRSLGSYCEGSGRRGERTRREREDGRRGRRAGDGDVGERGRGDEGSVAEREEEGIGRRG